ncbi:hypothetical protein [Halorubrum sp. SD626R]|uniref:hypothetical protein n=1 Tax=Halorubrum sp. SD626R TaxID=1419722 RepID=UPI000B1A4AD5|nr:hypothetical protein [Halorubrum sp. SD626R]TKX79917.1 hypothetical protein EXE53_13520 [Halorubrum sp. SD626R]
MRLYISSGAHVDEVDERIVEITDHLEAPDMVFGEGGEASLIKQSITIAYLFPRAPLIALAAAIQVILILGFFGRIVSIVTGGTKGKDTEIMERIASKYNAKICEIDSIHTARPVYDRPILWGLANWIPTIGLIVALVLDAQPLSVVIVSLLIGYILLHTMLYLVNSKREEKMAETVQSRVENVETACVVLGESHHVGVGKRLIDSGKIDVLNPIPDDLGLLAKCNIYVWGVIDSARDRLRG